MGDGTVGDVRILQPASMDELRTQVWRYDPQAPNVADYDGHLNAYAAGIRIITGETPGDRLFTGDDRTWFGHFGEAYGLLAGVFVDPDTGDGVIYAITGTAFDPYAEDDDSSTLMPIEAAVLDQLGRLL